MSGAGSTEDQPDLRALLEEVFRTRAARIEEQRQRGATAQTLLPVRRAALEALENYNVALTLRGWPTPSRMHQDIELLRSLCGVRGTVPQR